MHKADRKSEKSNPLLVWVWAIVISFAATATFKVLAHQGHVHSPQYENKESPSNSADKNAFEEINLAYNSEVKSVFEKKCADCHSVNSKSPWYGGIPILHGIVERDRTEAKKHLEISKGFPFSGHGTPLEDLQAISEVIAKNKMPTKIYMFFHPSSQLTKEEKERVISWTAAGIEKLRLLATEPGQE